MTRSAALRDARRDYRTRESLAELLRGRILELDAASVAPLLRLGVPALRRFLEPLLCHEQIPSRHAIALLIAKRQEVHGDRVIERRTPLEKLQRADWILIHAVAVVIKDAKIRDGRSEVFFRRFLKETLS